MRRLALIIALCVALAPGFADAADSPFRKASKA